MNFASGAYTFASDTVGGIEYPLAKYVWGASGEANPVTKDSPLPVDASSGELIEAIESLRMAVHALTRSIGMSMPDAAGRLRVLTDASSAIGTVSTVSTVTGVTTVSTLTNQAQVGGFAAQDQIAALMRTSADMLRQSTVATS